MVTWIAFSASLASEVLVLGRIRPPLKSSPASRGESCQMTANITIEFISIQSQEYRVLGELILA